MNTINFKIKYKNFESNKLIAFFPCKYWICTHFINMHLKLFKKKNFKFL